MLVNGLLIGGMALSLAFGVFAIVDYKRALNGKKTVLFEVDNGTRKND